MGSKWKQVQSAFTIKDIGAYLMANLAKGLYTGPEVIREYVQNAVDSYVEFTTVIPELPENEVRVTQMRLSWGSRPRLYAFATLRGL